MTPRFAILCLLLVSGVGPAAAQNPAVPLSGVGDPLTANVASLGSLDYAVRTRAARLLRRAPENQAVPALTAAVRNPRADEYVRYRAFVLLTSFGDRGLPALVHDMLRDPNDRVRETAYKWLEQHPDAELIPTLVAALNTEQAEFVRPALVNALAALGSDARVQQALVVEVDRGLDLFRSSVIDALGRHHAAYAVDAIAPLAREDGPLRGEAILALGRIGGEKARGVLSQLGTLPGEAGITLQAAQCIAADSCATQIAALKAAATGTFVRQAAVQAAVGGLGNIAEAGHVEALDAIVAVSSTAPLRDAASVVLGVTALRQPERVLAWFASLAPSVRGQALDLLKDGFESLEEDYGEEQFYAATRAGYWKAPENSPARTLAASIIERLEF